MALANKDRAADGFFVENLIKVVQSAVDQVKIKIDMLRNNQSSIAIADMFEMQMEMNNLAQLSEMATGVVASAHSATMSMARNVKS